MKKRHYYIFALLTLITIGAKAQIVTYQDAKNAVLQLYSDTIYDEYQIYQYSDILYQNSVVATLFDTITTTEKDGYLFFVDESPRSNWGHNCKYIFVDASDTSVATFSWKMPPSNFDFYEIIKASSIDLSSNLVIPDFGKNNNSSKRCANNDSQYAVIISGGMDKDNNFLRFWNDCALIYKTLVQTYGYKKSNIYVLMSDGQNPEDDLVAIDDNEHRHYSSSPLDLDGDGIGDIQYASNRSNISLVFDSLAAKMTADDNLFIFTTGHGMRDEVAYENYLCLWNDRISTREFGDELLKLNQNIVVNTVMGQCYSGGFSNCTNNGINRVSTFACPYNGESQAYNNYDLFVYNFGAALNGFLPSSQYSVNADADNNGEISMHEVFEYVSTYDVRDHPLQTTSNYYLPNVLTMCNKDRFDLVISDSQEDSGIEPNRSTEYMYLSNDIYVRLSQDGFANQEHQNPISGQEAHVYVKVKNNSYKSYDSEQPEGSLNLYWAKAGLGLSWPNPWEGENSINGIVLGGLIGTLPIVTPELEYFKGYSAGLDKIYEFVWQVPNLEDYADLPENWHFCLLAVMDSEIDPLSDVDCENDLDKFVRNNNNVAWKNISIIDRENNSQPTYVSVNNWNEQAINANMLFVNAKNEVNPLLHEVADITITLNKPLFELFLDNLSSAYGLEVCQDKDYSFSIKKDSANIDLILQPNQLYLLGLDIDFLIGKGQDKDYYKYDICLRDKDRNLEVIGGEQYVIERWETNEGINVDAGEDYVIHAGESVTLNAANAGVEASYKWIDNRSDTVVVSQVFSVAPSETRQYILKVETNDGFVGYDSTKVIVKADFIESISPNPTGNFVTVMYDISHQASNAYFEIMNNAGVVVANCPINVLEKQHIIDCTTLPVGQYSLILNCNGQRKDAKVLIINR